MFGLLRNRDFGLLWLAGLIAFAGNTAWIFALPLHIYRETDSTLATAAVMAVALVPRVFFSSVAGVFVDQWDRKRTMVVTISAQAVLLLPVLAAPNELVLLYTVAAIQGMVGLFLRPAEGALLPKLVGEEHLVSANALNALNNNLGMLIGPAMGTLLYAYMGIDGTVLGTAAAFLLSALMISMIAADTRPERDDAPSGEAIWTKTVSDWRAGLRMVRGDRALKVLFGASVVNALSDGVFVTLGLAPLVLDVLGGTPAQVGWLGSAQAVGGIIAGLVVVRIGHRLSRRWLLGGGIAGIGLADLGSANARLIASAGTPAVGVAMGCMAGAGLPAVASGTGRQTIVQEQAPDAFRGRVFGALASADGLALIVGLAAGGLLGESVSIVVLLSIAASLRIAGGLSVFILLPREETSRRLSPAPVEVTLSESDAPSSGT
jgi:MFS family permease